MTGPALDGWRYLWGCGIGVLLGIWYGFLRPLRPRHTALSDLLFLPALIYAWLYLSFAICRGDIRLGYTMGLLTGAFCWEMTVGRWLRPVFQGFWRLFSIIWNGFWGVFKKFFKKIRKKSKILFALWKKWFTIKESNHYRMRRNKGGVRNGKKEKLF